MVLIILPNSVAMHNYLPSLLKLTLITGLIVITGCKKDKPNIELTFCNGGMVPDTVTFSETNLDGADYIWTIFDEDGNSIIGPASTGSLNSAFTRFDNTGTYKIKVDVDNESSSERDFTLKDFVTEGSQRAVSFFDNFSVLWTVYPDSDCHAAVRVKKVNGVGGIDYYQEENKIYYVAGNDMLFCFPNGESLTTLNGNQGFTDIVIEQSTRKVFLSTFSDTIFQTTVGNLVTAVQGGSFDADYPVDNFVGQLTYDPQGNTFYFTGDNADVSSREAVAGAPTETNQFGSASIKTAVAFDIRNRRLYFAEKGDPCRIVVINPDQPGQPVTTYLVPCQDEIEGMDIDEQERDLVYTDGENVWMFNLDNATNVVALVNGYNRTMQKGNLNFDDSIELPIGDVVIAKYED
jgi:hypothetical protein